ncbi:MAG TPA: two-component sensor histidine kinase, partial [Actinopolymorphaceae bacterium]
MKDFPAIAAIAGACSGVVGLLGVLTVRLFRRRSVVHAFLAVAIVSVLAFVAGILGTAQAMFLSPHDFQVTLMVSGVAGVVSIAIALLLARQVAKGSEALRAATRELGVAGSYTPPGRTP